MGDAFEQAEGDVGVGAYFMSGSIAFNKGLKGIQPPPQTAEKFDRLKDLLRAMFQFEDRDNIPNVLQWPSDSHSITAIELISAR